MKTRCIFMFKYYFRAPGSQVESPIRFAVGRTVRGRVIVCRSQHSICAIFAGEEAHALRDQFAASLLDFELQAHQVALEAELNQVVVFMDRYTSEGVINVASGGSAFEQKVWQALCGMPSSKTRSYGGEARALGVPEAVRAVVGARTANVLAVAIPCHRVVRSDGAISGSCRGVERKRAPLANAATEETVKFSA